MTICNFTGEKIKLLQNPRNSRIPMRWRGYLGNRYKPISMQMGNKTFNTHTVELEKTRSFQNRVSFKVDYFIPDNHSYKSLLSLPKAWFSKTNKLELQSKTKPKQQACSSSFFHVAQYL